METSNLDSPDDADTLITELTEYLDKAEAMMASGSYVALGGLDDAVAALCKRMETLRVDEAQHYVPKLEALTVRLDALQAVMSSVRDQVRSEIDASAVRQKASKAYRKDPK